MGTKNSRFSTSPPRWLWFTRYESREQLTQSPQPIAASISPTLYHYEHSPSTRIIRVMCHNPSSTTTLLVLFTEARFLTDHETSKHTLWSRSLPAYGLRRWQYSPLPSYENDGVSCQQMISLRMAASGGPGSDSGHFDAQISIRQQSERLVW
jgi:hypothetical protein